METGQQDIQRPLIGVVLAAGKGTRMKSALPKVLHCLLGRPILVYVLDLLDELEAVQKVVIVGHGAERVQEVVGSQGLDFVLQKEQLGTGHAVQQTRELLQGAKADILIICGDTPLFTRDTLEKFVLEHRTKGSRLSILSSIFKNPFGYGRIIKRPGCDDAIEKIVEERDATPDERRVKEINTGTYLVDSDLLFPLLSRLDADNDQGEYYLTDIVAHAVSQGEKVFAFPFASEEEALGINSRLHLSRAESILLDRLRSHWMAEGVTFELAHATYLEPTVQLGNDVVIGPHVVMEGRVIIGSGARIGAFSYLKDVKIDEGAVIPPCSNLQ